MTKIKVFFSKKYLLLSNVFVSCVASGLADLFRQQCEILSRQIHYYDVERTKKMALAGFCTGVVCHFWYSYLDHFIPGQTFKCVLKKVLADLVVCAPITTTVCLMSTNLLENNSFTDFVKDVQYKAWRLYMAQWMVWPSVQFINFYLLPLKYRIMYDNVVSFGYEVYKSQIVEEIQETESP